MRSFGITYIWATGPLLGEGTEHRGRRQDGLRPDAKTASEHLAPLPVPKAIFPTLSYLATKTARDYRLQWAAIFGRVRLIAGMRNSCGVNL